MNKKVSLGVTIAIAVVSVAATFAITMAVSQKIYNGIVEDLPQRIERYDNLAEIDDIIHKEYYDKHDSDVINKNIQKGYIKGLGDGYSKYLTSDEYKKYCDVLNGDMTGIGVEASYNSDEQQAYITKIYHKSPAELNGLKTDDIILAVDEEAITSGNYTKLFEKLTEGREKSVKVTYKRGDFENTVTVPVGFKLETVDYEIKDTVGYIRINMFNEFTQEQLKSAIESFSEVKGIVIDLRGTDTGEIRYAAKTADVIVPAADGTGALATAKKANGNVVETFTSDSSDVSIPIIVLVDRKTSGAAELFACSLRDFSKAQLVGKRTKGNATMQKVFKLDKGNVLLLTVALVEPYKSESYSGNGIIPDYDVTELKNDTDEQLEKAISLLKNN